MAPVTRGSTYGPLRTTSLHRRVAIAVLALLLGVLVGLGLTVNYLLGQRMRDDLRQRLLDRATIATTLADQGVGGQTLADRLTGQGISVRLVEGSSTIYGRQAADPPARSDGRRPPHPKAPVTDVPVTTDGNQIRADLTVGDATLQLRTSDVEIGHTLSLLRRIEVVAGAITLCLAGLLLIRAVGVALAPLRRMTSLAHTIRDGGRGTRLRPTRPGTDIGRTAAAFDQMLDALETAEARAQRAAFEAGSAEAEARAAEARMRRLLADVSHDLRTPLAGTIASAEQLLRTDPPRRDRETRLVELVRESSRAARLVDDLLLSARLEQPSGDDHAVVCTVSLDVVVAELSESARRRSSAVRVTGTGADGVLVLAGRDHVQRALGNLIDNALAASAPGEEVRIEVGRSPVRGVVSVAGKGLHSADPGCGWAVISVRDSGGGVHPDDRERIFDRFVRADASRSTPGSGLGLPIARTIARSHGGDVRLVPSTVGACFELTLPAVPAPGCLDDRGARRQPDVLTR